MINNPNIKEIPFWKTKCNIILAEHYFKNSSKISKKIRNRYKANISFIKIQPHDQDLVTSFLIREGFLEKRESEESTIINITKEGSYTLEKEVLETETKKRWEDGLILAIITSSLIVSLGGFIIAAILK